MTSASYNGLNKREIEAVLLYSIAEEGPRGDYPPAWAFSYFREDYEALLAQKPLPHLSEIQQIAITAFPLGIDDLKWEELITQLKELALLEYGREVLKETFRDLNSETIDSPYSILSKAQQEIGRLLEYAISDEDVGEKLGDLPAEPKEPVPWELLKIWLYPGELVTVSALTNSGKTALALDLAYTLARRGYPVQFISMEMDSIQLTLRLMSRFFKDEKGETWMLRKEYYRDPVAFKQKYQDVLEHIKNLPIWVKYGVSTDELIPLIYKFGRTKGAEKTPIIILDYLQLAVRPRPGESMSDAIERQVWSLKTAAQQLQALVVQLAQVNRAMEAEVQRNNKGNKQLMLWGLKGSSAIEQHSDVVIFINLPEEERINNVNEKHAKIVIAKNRSGPCKAVEAIFYAGQQRWRSVSLD